MFLILGFSAVLESSKTFLKGEKVTFDKVLTNIGDGYDPNTGMFTASTTGLYQFSTTIKAKTDDDKVSCFFKVNSQLRIRVFGSRGGAVGAVTDVMPLSVGDKVYIEMWEDGSISGSSFSSFSGHLIN